MKNILTSLILLITFIGCIQQESQEDIFKNVPKKKTIPFIDSIIHKIRLDAGMNFTARPENQLYYDERNFRDSLGNLREYSIIQCWDTGEVVTNFYYENNQLINVTKKTFTTNVIERCYYYFRNDTLIYVYGTTPLLSTDTILSRAYRYLSYKEDIGDTAYRKYFKEKSHPPNSILELIN